MGITKDRGYYYWVKRVPKRFEGLVLGSDGKPVKQVRQALFTDSRAEAELKAVQIEAARMARALEQLALNFEFNTPPSADRIFTDAYLPTDGTLMLN